jgi:hypothetical protein
LSFGGEGGKGKDGKGGDWGKNKEKMKKCMEEEKKLMECCPYPKGDDMKDDPDCKHHLDGVDKKEDKEKHKAYSCFSECIAKKKGVLDADGKLDEAKLKSEMEEYLKANDAADLVDPTTNAIQSCLDDCKTESLSSEIKLCKFPFNSQSQEGEVDVAEQERHRRMEGKRQGQGWRKEMQRSLRHGRPLRNGKSCPRK